MASASGTGSPGKRRHDEGEQRGVLTKLDLHYLDDTRPVYACKGCSEVVALQDEMVSRAFTGSSGRAYLMNSTINTDLGKREERNLTTGRHTVADLMCAACGAKLGWMYIKAVNADQKYKEGEWLVNGGLRVEVPPFLVLRYPVAGRN